MLSSGRWRKVFRDKPDGRGQEFDRDGKGQEFDRDAKRQEGGKRVGEKGQRVGATREGDGCLFEMPQGNDSGEQRAVEICRIGSSAIRGYYLSKGILRAAEAGGLAVFFFSARVEAWLLPFGSPVQVSSGSCPESWGPDS